MKKVNLNLGILAVAVLGFFSAQAQRHGSKSDNVMDVGSVTLNIGVGVGRSSFGNYGVYGSGYYGYGTGLGTKIAIERGMWQLGPGVLTLGLEAGASFSTARYNNYKSSIIIVAARSAYHFGWNVDNLDTYAGVSVGPGFRSNDYNNGSKYTQHDVVVAPGIFVGGSYFFSPNIGVNVEAGYDITEIQGGIIFKLK
jgi:hypothetical protein